MSQDRQTEGVEVEPMQQAVDQHLERFAPERLLGLMAQLALPELRGADGVFRKPLVEIEVAPGLWVPIDAVSREGGSLVFTEGVNGHTSRYRFTEQEGCPPWRRGRRGVVHGLGVGCS